MHHSKCCGCGSRDRLDVSGDPKHNRHGHHHHHGDHDHSHKAPIPKKKTQHKSNLSSHFSMHRHNESIVNYTN